MKGLITLAILLTAPEVIAGNWGANWGHMYWGNNPTSAPQAPTIISIEGGTEELLVRFTPGGDGFSVITSYTVTCGSIIVEGTDSPITIPNLINDSEYDCTVVAFNDIGEGEPSFVVSGVPQEQFQGLNIILIKAAMDSKKS